MSNLFTKKPTRSDTAVVNRLDKYKNKLARFDSTQLKVQIPKHIHHQFKIKTAKKNTDMRAVILDNIIKYLESND